MYTKFEKVMDLFREAFRATIVNQFRGGFNQKQCFQHLQSAFSHRVLLLCRVQAWKKEIRR
jgi:hypothetical protein